MLDRHPASQTPESPGSEPLAAPEIQVRVGTRLWHMQRELILATLGHLSGDKRAAARTLGISLKTLYNRLGTYGDQGWVRRRPATGTNDMRYSAESRPNSARTERF